MKLKPISINVNIPIYHFFKNKEDIATFATNINTIIHGKSKLKYEELGTFNNEFIVIFYIERNKDYKDLRNFVINYYSEENK